MTDQTGKDAGDGKGEGTDAQAQPSVDDLNLVTIDEDAGKSPEELWNEFDAAEGEKAADDKGTDTTATKGDDADSDKDAAAADAEDADDDEPDKSAADKSKGADAAKDGGKGAPDKQKQSAEGEAAEPTLAELKAERDRLKAENERLAQADRSNRGRVSALQQKLDAQRGVGKTAATKPPVKKKPFQNEKGKDFVKEYPEVAAPVAAELEEVRSELDELKADRARREQAETNDRLIRNEKVLDEKHPKWEETAASKEFGDWVVDPETPDLIRAAVKRNEHAIVDAKEAVFLFDAFKAFRSSQAGGEKNTQRQGNEAGNGKAQDGPNGKGGNANADGKNGSSLSGKRQRQLESSSGTRSTGPGLVDGVPEEGDPEEIWKAFDRQEERQERQARRA